MRAATTTRRGPDRRATRRPPGRLDSHKRWTDRRGLVTNSYPQPFGYTGAYTNPTTGLIHLGARYYDPTLGRFTEPDPQTHPGDTTQSSPYPYAGNDPINNTDPSGQGFGDFLKDAGKIAVGVVGIAAGAAACTVGALVCAVAGAAIGAGTGAASSAIGGGSTSDIENAAIVGGAVGAIGGSVGRYVGRYFYSGTHG